MPFVMTLVPNTNYRKFREGSTACSQLAWATTWCEFEGTDRMGVIGVVLVGHGSNYVHSN